MEFEAIGHIEVEGGAFHSDVVGQVLALITEAVDLSVSGVGEVHSDAVPQSQGIQRGLVVKTSCHKSQPPLEYLRIHFLQWMQQFFTDRTQMAHGHQAEQSHGKHRKGTCEFPNHDDSVWSLSGHLLLLFRSCFWSRVEFVGRLVSFIEQTGATLSSIATWLLSLYLNVVSKILQ